MISSLRLINFKPFENQLLEFKPLTLLSGLNSTGKSSVLQSLLLLRQSYLVERLEQYLTLKGELVDIGTAQDAFCERGKENYIGFEINWENGNKGIWHFEYDLQKQKDNVMKLKNLESVASEGVYTSSLFDIVEFQYLQAERISSSSI